MIDGFIVVTYKTFWSEEAPKVFAIRKFDNTKKYANVIKSLTKQIKSRSDFFDDLTPSTFDDIFEVCLYSFTKTGWPRLEGELRYFLR